MLEILKINLNYLKNSESFFYDSDISKIIKNTIQKERLITITGLYTINKTSYINLNLNNSTNTIFYFNKNLDFFNKIKNKSDLTELIKEFNLKYNKPNYIVLENCSKIEDIKKFISTFYKTGYKIIIIDNNISIPSKPEIEIFSPDYKTLKNKLENNYSINNALIFGTTEEISLVNNNKIKIEILNSLKDEILLRDLIEIYSIKNTFLLNQIITFLSFLNTRVTLRELHRNISKNINIALITFIEYIDYLLNAKLIKRCYNYDFKKQKTIKTKTKYYFSDLGIKNSFNYFSSNKTTAIENLVFNELEKNGYKVKSATNGQFDFSFYAKKSTKSEFTKKIQKIYIHLSEASDRNQLKKEVNKLNKVPYFPTVSKSKENINETISRYLIVENIKDFSIKKLQYDEVKIVELEDFLIKI